MRVKFTADHDDVTPEKTVSYKAGDEVTVRKELGEALLGKKLEAVPDVASKPPTTGKDGDGK